jgi:pyridoxal 5'-phosphate synthase pdxT subunit
MTPRIGVLALQGDVREHVHAFEDCGADVVTVRTADELAGVDALSIPGGESTTLSRLIRAFGLEGPLRGRLAAGMPCLGTCAGMILLSKNVLDGRPDQLAFGVVDIDVRRNGYGRQVDSFEALVNVTGLENGPLRAVFIRAPLVERAGAEVTVIGALDRHPVAVTQGSCMALSFHPELTSDRRLFAAFVQRTEASLGGDGGGSP